MPYHFFTTKSDITNLLIATETKIDLFYTLMGNFEENDIISYGRGAAIRDLGLSSSDTGSTSDSYLVTLASDDVSVRQLVGADGKMRFLVDQAINDHSITFTPAGIRDRTILMGRFATVWKSEKAKMIMKEFHGVLKTQFSNIGGYWIGPEALDLHVLGTRLAASVHSPTSINLLS